MSTYSPDFDPLPLYTPALFRRDTSSYSPTCVLTLWIVLYCVRYKFFITHVGFLESTSKIKVRVREYFCNGLFTKTDLKKTLKL